MMHLFYDGNNNVNLIYYTDLPDELKTQPHLSVEAVPDPENKPGKRPVLKADETHYWYVYEDDITKKTQEELDRLAIMEGLAGIYEILTAGDTAK